MSNRHQQTCNHHRYWTAEDCKWGKQRGFAWALQEVAYRYQTPVAIIRIMRYVMLWWITYVWKGFTRISLKSQLCVNEPTRNDKVREKKTGLEERTWTKIMKEHRKGDWLTQMLFANYLTKGWPSDVRRLVELFQQLYHMALLESLLNPYLHTMMVQAETKCNIGSIDGPR